MRAPAPATAPRPVDDPEWAKLMKTLGGPCRECRREIEITRAFICWGFTGYIAHLRCFADSEMHRLLTGRVSS